jgi:hypothetical protein
MSFFDCDEYMRRVAGLSLRHVSDYEENITLTGELFGTKRPALLLAQSLIDQQTMDPSKRIILWHSFFSWIKTRQVRFVQEETSA